MARIYETNDRVIMVEDGVIRHGVIAQVFEGLPVVIVKFDDGEVEKVNPQRLAIEPVEKKEEPKVDETIEKNEIMLTREMFKKAVVKLAAKTATEHDPLIGLTYTIFGVELERELFDESEGNA